MTLQEAKSIARHLGLTLRTVRSGDYRVKFRDGNATTASAEGPQLGGILATPALSNHCGAGRRAEPVALLA
jgi:hypothetical protein